MLAWPSCSCAIFTGTLQIVQQRRMNVAELMPRHPSQPRRSAAGCSTFVSSFDSRNGSPLRLPNTRSSAPCRLDALPMRRQRRDRVWPERNRPHGLLRLRRLELSLEHRLAHRQRADLQIERRHRSASNSPILNPVAAMRLTIVRYGSSTCLSSFAKPSPAIIAGFSFERLLRELHAPRRIRREIPVFDRRFENAGEQHPRVSDRLPAALLPELLRDPLLNRQPFDVAEPPVPPRRKDVHVEHGLVAVLRRALKVGSTSIFHCVSTNVPNAMIDSGLLAPWLTARSRSSSFACASRRFGSSATDPSGFRSSHSPDGAMSRTTRPRATAITHTLRRLPLLKASLSEIFDEPRLTSFLEARLAFWSRRWIRRRRGARQRTLASLAEA